MKINFEKRKEIATNYTKIAQPVNHALSHFRDGEINGIRVSENGMVGAILLPYHFPDEEEVILLFENRVTIHTCIENACEHLDVKMDADNCVVEAVENMEINILT